MTRSTEDTAHRWQGDGGGLLHQRVGSPPKVWRGLWPILPNRRGVSIPNRTEAGSDPPCKLRVPAPLLGPRDLGRCQWQVRLRAGGDLRHGMADQDRRRIGDEGATTGRVWAVDVKAGSTRRQSPADRSPAALA